MKKWKFIVVILLLTNFVSSQTEDTTIKVIRMDASKKATLEAVPINSPPKEPDHWVVDDDFLKPLLKHFTYDPEFFEPFNKTIFYYANATEEGITDSILVAEKDLDTYTFIRNGGEWMIQNFIIVTSPLSIHNIRVGMTSKEVFEILKRKTKKKVDDGKVWISQKDGKVNIELTFEKDKVVMMKL